MFGILVHLDKTVQSTSSVETTSQNTTSPYITTVTTSGTTITHSCKCWPCVQYNVTPAWQYREVVTPKCEWKPNCGWMNCKPVPLQSCTQVYGLSVSWQPG